MIFIEKKYIRLSIFSSVSSKTQLSFFFFRVSIKIFHDETFSIFFKNKTAKKRIDKLMFLNSRLNNDFFQSTLFEEFDEMIVSKFVLFQKNYHISALKTIIHKNMFHDYEKTKKQHFVEWIATIEIWIKKRRSWKIKTCMTIYEIYRYDLIWSVFHIKMIQFFREWTINDSVQNHEIHRSLSAWNLTEFDADFDVETNIESIKIIFVSAFGLAFKKSVTSEKKFVKTNSNVDDVIIIMINQSWFFFFCAISKFFDFDSFFFLNFFSFLNFWFIFFVWFFIDTFLSLGSDYFWFEFSFEFKFTIFCFFFISVFQFFLSEIFQITVFFLKFRILKSFVSFEIWVVSFLLKFFSLSHHTFHVTKTWQIFFWWRTNVMGYFKGHEKFHGTEGRSPSYVI